MGRVTKVFYGTDALPYKDKERQVHYPVVGNSFTGASDTTKIRFYVKDIGGVENVTWVAVVKLPNGKIGFKVLSTIGNDLDVGERYVEFSLNSFYTQYNGDLAIALKGYQGNIQVEEDEETGIYEIVGTPTIQATGVIKLSVNYSTQLPVTETLSPDQLIQLMALIAEKLNIASGIVVLLNDEEDISGYTNGQLFYIVSRNQFMQLVENELEEKELKAYDLVPGQQATMSIIANPLTNVNGRVLSAYESTIVIINGYQCYKITRGGENLTEEYASRYMEYMTGSKYLPKYDYYHPKNTYFITPSGLILKPQYDNTNGLLLYPMTNLATKDYVDNDILEITNTSTPLTYEQRQKILTNNVRIKYNNFYYEKVNHVGHNVRFERADLVFDTNQDGSTTISKRFIVIRDDTGSITSNVRQLVTYSKEQADQYFANNVEMSIDSNYVLKVKLIDKNGDTLAEDSVDLPLESIVQGAQYYETYTYQGTTYEKVIVITLATTSVPTIIPVGDLVSGLVSESTYNSGMATKVEKTNSANKVYGTNGSGSQTTFNIDSNVSGNVARRDSNSQINVPLSPTSDTHASSKGYTDGFAKDLALSLDQSTYVLTATLKNASGGNIVARTIDLPLETMVVSGSYNEINKAIVLILKNGQTISIPVGDLIEGLVSADYLQANYYNKTQIDEMVAGFVFADVDDHLSSVSTNPVENRVITLALEEKANVNGSYETLHAGTASNLSTDQGPTIDAGITEQSGDNYPDRPNNAKGTGTYFPYGDNDLVTVENGNETIEKVYGHSYVKNQLASANGNNVSNYICTCTKTSSSSQWFGFNNLPNIVDGHKYYIMVSKLTGTIPSSNTYLLFGGEPNKVNLYTYPNGNIITISSHNTLSYGLVAASDIASGTTISFDLRIIDLTQLDQELANTPNLTADMVLKAYPDILNWDYNTGTMIDAEDFTYSSGGINLFDEETELGSYNTTTGQKESGSPNIISKNYIKVIKQALFINKTNFDYVCCYDENKNYLGLSSYEQSGNGYIINLLPNTAFITFKMSSSYGTTYNHDIQICLHYTDTEVENTYHPYVAPATKLIKYYGGVGRSAGSVADEVNYVNKKRIKRVGVVDLGSLSWTYVSDETYLYASVTGMSTNNVRDNLVSAKYQSANVINIASLGNNQIAKGLGENKIYIKDIAYTDAATFKTAMSGVYLYYELATPIEEDIPQDELNNILPCNDYGIESKSDGVIAGMKVKYQLNPLRTIFNNKSGVASLTTRVETLENKPSELPTLPADASTKTYVLKLVNGVLTWVEEQ